MNRFQSLGIREPILTALTHMGYREPTLIQEKAIPAGLQGRDVLGAAQTGTGKTCAFGVPILQRLSEAKAEKKTRGIRALILTPTRELALQIHENLLAYGRGLALRMAVIFGGVGQAPQVEQLRQGVDVLTATPGRLLDLAGQGLLDLSHIEIFVLDEADRMLDMGFIHDVRKVIRLIPEQRQTMFFSATLPPEILDLVDTLLHDPVKVSAAPVSSPVEAIRQEVCLVDRKNKTALLALLLEEEQVKNALVFTRTKHGADKVARDLIQRGIAAAAIHGNKSQTARQESLRRFKAGELQVLVATDIAARGLDIEELSHVFNYNLSEVPETYIHRIGRTGRAGHGGTAISFCDFSEQPMLKDIETLLKKPVPRREHPFPMEVFEIPKDAKGRPVSAEDVEARQAAREKQRQRQAEKRAKLQEKRDKQNQEWSRLVDEQLAIRAAVREKAGADLKHSLSQPSADSSLGEGATGGKKRQDLNRAVGQKTGTLDLNHSFSQPLADSSLGEGATGGKDAKKRRGYPHGKQNRGDLQAFLDSQPTAAAPVVEPKTVHRNPLEGDVIMDATARMLAAKPVFQYYKPPTGRRSNKPTQKPAQASHSASEPSNTTNHTQPGKRRKGAPNAGKRPQEGQNGKAAQAIQQKTARPQEHAKKTAPRKQDRRPGSTRLPRSVEAPRSRQKDSTEQESLMKPFYIHQD